MVSNARLDLPEPDRPVMTTRASLGSSREMSLRLCSLAPLTTILLDEAMSLAIVFGPLPPERVFGPAPPSTMGRGPRAVLFAPAPRASRPALRSRSDRPVGQDARRWGSGSTTTRPPWRPSG